MLHAIAAYLHFVAIFLLFAVLVVEHQLIRLPLTLERARSLFRTDIAFGLIAGLVLLTGTARTLRYGKGLDYYLNNSLFHAKIGLFVAVVLLSIYPTLTFLGWRAALKAGQVPPLSAASAARLKLAIRVELALLLAMPAAAVLMARGIGVIAR